MPTVVPPVPAAGARVTVMVVGSVGVGSVTTAVGGLGGVGGSAQMVRAKDAALVGTHWALPQHGLPA